MSHPSKRQNLPVGTLWVVATPIGNLADLSPRARETLSRASRVLCEDTRRTMALLASLGLTARLERLDAHTEGARASELVEALRAGEELALVSDAGTPGVSDPGARLVRAAREAGVAVVPVPGPSAVAAFVSAAGFRAGSFAFRGFFPRKDGERKAELAGALADPRAGATIWFESPERIREVLAKFSQWQASGEVVGLDRAWFFLAKEMTKTHEAYLAGALGEVIAELERRIGEDAEFERGEWCFGLEAPELKAEDDAAGTDAGAWLKALELLLKAGVAPSDAAKHVSKAYGVARNAVYEATLKFSGKK